LGLYRSSAASNRDASIQLWSIWNADQHSGAEGKARQLWTVV
jgi:hypothetical protein